MKSFKFFVGAIIFLLSICFINCASDSDFTVRVAGDMKKMNVSENFRFYVSTNVELRRTESETGSANKNTVVRQRIVNDVIQLKKNTTGRARAYDGESIEIQFEPADRNGVYRTMRFVLKPRDGSPKPDDLFYFFYEPDVEETESVERGVIRRTIVQGNIIKYGKDGNGVDILYEVTYKGKKEPFLLYKEDVKEKTKKRTLRGVR